MRIVIVCTMLKRFGGKGMYNLQELGLAMELAKMGHEVSVIKGVPDAEQEEFVNDPSGATVKYVAMQKVGGHGYLDCSLLPSRLDAVFCFCDQQIFMKHVYNWRRERGVAFIPYIGTSHSLYAGTMKGYIADAIFVRTTLPIYKKMHVLCKTPAVQEGLRSLGVTDTEVAPVGLDVQAMKPNLTGYCREEERAKLGIGPDEMGILCVSRLEKDKHPEMLISILEKVLADRPAKLIVVGEGDMKERLIADAKERGIADKLRFLSKIPYEEMWKLYISCDRYVNVSPNEIFGMAVMEAAYYMTPVVAMESLDIKVSLAGMQAHALCRNENGMVRAILAPDPSEEAIRHDREKVIRDLSWRRTAEVIIRTIRRYKGGDAYVEVA